MKVTAATPTNALYGANRKALRSAAEQIETTFLAEMLKSAGLGKSGANYFGGVGEDQFSSFLVNEHAAALVDAGGIGLSEDIYQALIRTENYG